jgi:hypothetical protein
MRTIGIVLLGFTASLALAQQPAISSLAPFGEIQIPARLNKTLRADKTHVGDTVEFRTLEPVLVSKGLVMPADARLRGRVLSVSPKRENTNSWLAVVVERAQWKQHSLPLHAFIAAQITISHAINPGTPEASNAANLPASVAARATARMSGRVAVVDDPTLSKLIKAPQDATVPDQDHSNTRPASLEDAGIVRNKDGNIYLVSSRTHVKLPSGLLLMLKNEPITSPVASGAKTATSASAER